MALMSSRRGIGRTGRTSGPGRASMEKPDRIWDQHIRAGTSWDQRAGTIFPMWVSQPSEASDRYTGLPAGNGRPGNSREPPHRDPPSCTGGQSHGLVPAGGSQLSTSVYGSQSEVWSQLDPRVVSARSGFSIDALPRDPKLESGEKRS